MTLHELLGYPLARALEAAKASGLPAPDVEYTLAPSRRDEDTREGMTPRVIGVKGNTLIVSCFRDQTPREKEER